MAVQNATQQKRKFRGNGKQFRTREFTLAYLFASSVVFTLGYLGYYLMAAYSNYTNTTWQEALTSGGIFFFILQIYVAFTLGNKIRQATGLRNPSKTTIAPEFQSVANIPGAASILPTLKINGKSVFKLTIQNLFSPSHTSTFKFQGLSLFKQKEPTKQQYIKIRTYQRQKLHQEWAEAMAVHQKIQERQKLLQDSQHHQWDSLLFKSPLQSTLDKATLTNQISGQVLLQWLETVEKRDKKLGKGRGVSQNYWNTRAATKQHDWWRPHYYNHIRAIIQATEANLGIQIIAILPNRWQFLNLPAREAFRFICKYYFPEMFADTAPGKPVQSKHL